MKSIDNWLEAKLEDLLCAYEDGNLGAVKDAVYWCGKYKSPLPDWANFALFELIDAAALDDKAELNRWKAWLKKYRQCMSDYEVWDEVLVAREHGVEWKDIYGIVGILISGKSEDDGGPKAGTLKKAYERANGDKKHPGMKKNPGMFYLLETFKKRNDYPPIDKNLWDFIKNTIKAGKPRGVKKQ